MSTFSTTVTQAQRNSRDFDSRGREISICSRQHTNRPGYNPSPYELKIISTKPRPNTRMSQELAHESGVKAPSKKIKVTAKSRKDKR